ncbi:MAG: AgmX/PglI C-terminal domain-containing protein [Deltaproteobacteria bacterium]|nr:AgmX/PglI C-terminal domain-containing protein [Deltaproteobacteria bacterium]
MRARGCVGLLLIAAAEGCVEAHAQPRPGTRDAGVRRDAGAVVRRDAGVVRRDAGVDVPVLPPTRGRIDPAGAQRVLATRATEVRGCYERALARDATLQGELTVRLRVEADGRVSQTALSGDDALRGAGRCMETALRGLVFPAPTGGAATVTVPYVFRAGE